MLPVSPLTKLFIEQMELIIILVYLLWGVNKPKQFTYYLLLAIAICLTIDIVYYHAVRPLYVWGALNTPLFVLSVYVVYVKILHKSARVAWKKMGCVLFMLFRA